MPDETAHVQGAENPHNLQFIKHDKVSDSNLRTQSLILFPATCEILNSTCTRFIYYISIHLEAIFA